MHNPDWTEITVAQPNTALWVIRRKTTTSYRQPPRCAGIQSSTTVMKPPAPALLDGAPRVACLLDGAAFRQLLRPVGVWSKG